MTVGQGFSENSGGDMTQDGHDCRTYGTYAVNTQYLRQ